MARAVLACARPLFVPTVGGLRHVVAAAGWTGCCSAVRVESESDCWLERRVECAAGAAQRGCTAWRHSTALRSSALVARSAHCCALRAVRRVPRVARLGRRGVARAAMPRAALRIELRARRAGDTRARVRLVIAVRPRQACDGRAVFPQSPHASAGLGAGSDARADASQRPQATRGGFRTRGRGVRKFSTLEGSSSAALPILSSKFSLKAVRGAAAVEQNLPT